MILFGKFFPSTSQHGAEIRKAISSPIWLQSAHRTADTVLRNLATDEREHAFVRVFLSTISKTQYKRGFGFRLSVRSPGDLVEMRVSVEVVQGWERVGQSKRRADFILMDSGIQTVREVGEARRVALLDPQTVDRWLSAVMAAWIELVGIELPKQIQVSNAHRNFR